MRSEIKKSIFAHTKVDVSLGTQEIKTILFLIHIVSRTISSLGLQGTPTACPRHLLARTQHRKPRTEERAGHCCPWLPPVWTGTPHSRVRWKSRR